MARRYYLNLYHSNGELYGKRQIMIGERLFCSGAVIELEVEIVKPKRKQRKSKRGNASERQVSDRS